MTAALLLVVALSVSQETPQEKPRVPKDSIQVVVIGCLSGRALAVDDVRQTDTESGPVIRAKTFRLAGKKDVMAIVKEENHRIVEVTGIIKKSALIEPGVKLGNRVTVGGGSPVAGGGVPSPAENIPVMDVESVQPRGTSCGGGL